MKWINFKSLLVLGTIGLSASVYYMNFDYWYEEKNCYQPLAINVSQVFTPHGEIIWDEQKRSETSIIHWNAPALLQLEQRYQQHDLMDFNINGFIYEDSGASGTDPLKFDQKVTITGRVLIHKNSPIQRFFNGFTALGMIELKLKQGNYLASPSDFRKELLQQLELRRCLTDENIQGS